MSDQDWHRLARYVLARREWLGLTQEEIAVRGGPSTATMRLIEGGLQTSYRGRTLRSLEHHLGWAPGSVRSVLAGGEPELLRDGEQHANVDPDVAVIENYSGFTREEKELMLAMLHAMRGRTQPPAQRRRAEGE